MNQRPEGVHLDKREVVLIKVEEFCNDDMFFDAYTVDNEMLEALHMPRSTWEAFGKPEKLTITIEPGDKLNEQR